EYVAMPLGSSSEAPAIRPGPRIFRNGVFLDAGADRLLLAVMIGGCPVETAHDQPRPIPGKTSGIPGPASLAASFLSREGAMTRASGRISWAGKGGNHAPRHRFAAPFDRSEH